MAHVFPARDARNASTVGAILRAAQQPGLEHEAQQSLRRLKTRLQARFPLVKSSHLTEALACAFGYNTNAALLAGLPADAFELAYGRPDAARLRQRLVNFGYPLRDDFSTQAPPSRVPPPDYVARLAELRRLQRNPEHVGGRIHRLRAECAAQFAQAFGLGHPEVIEDKNVTQRWYAGVDHAACLPGWGELVNSGLGGRLDFPGSDHRAHFFQDLPVARKGKHCEYESAFVSMPYREAWAEPGKFEKAALYAGRVGWTVSVHSEWSWYQAGETELVLFRRTTNHEQVVQDWANSFSRWALENRSRLGRSGGELRRQMLDDILSCPHLPLDVRDFEDCRERYLREFAAHLYDDSSSERALDFRRLMQKWQDSRTA